MSLQLHADRLCDCALPSPFLYDRSVCENCHGSTGYGKALPARAQLTASRSGLLPNLQDQQYDSVSLAKVYAFAHPSSTHLPSRSKKESWASECSSMRPSTIDLHSRSCSNLSYLHGFGHKDALTRTESHSIFTKISEYHKALSLGLVEEDEQDEDVKPRKPHDSLIHNRSIADSKGSSSTLPQSQGSSRSPSFALLRDAISGAKNIRLQRIRPNTSPISRRNSHLLSYVSGHKNCVNAVVAEEDWVVSAGSDYKVNVWKTDMFAGGEGHPLASSTTAHKRAVQCLCWIDSSTFCSGSADTLIKVVVTQLWKLDNGLPSLAGTCKGHSSHVQQLLCPSPKVLISGCKGGSIFVWDIDRLRLLSSYTEDPHAITGLTQHSPSTFLSSSVSGSVRLWDLRNQRSITSFACHSTAVTALILWDEHSFVTSGGDQIRKWDLRTCAELQKWEERDVAAMCRLGVRLVTAGRRIRLVGVEEELEAHKGSVRTITVVPGTNWLAAGGSDSYLSVWRP